MTFSHVRASSRPLYCKLKILKLEDQVFLQNCLYDSLAFVYDAKTHLQSNANKSNTADSNISSQRRNQTLPK